MADPRHLMRPPAPIAPGMTIGLLGGSFNPAHKGHCHLSEVALKQLGLDYVWWLVAPQNPLKPTMGMAPLDNRVAYARRAAATNRRLIVMDIERLLGTRYTIDTVTALQRRFPQVRFVWLIGSDNLANFHRWRRWQQIAARLPIAVIMRPGSTLAQLSARAARRFCRHRKLSPKGFAHARPPAWIVLECPRNPLSSTQIRAASRYSEALVSALPTC